MTVTINSDCSIITFASAALTEVVGKTITGLTLRSKLNCSSTESELVLDDLIDSVTNGQLEVPAETFYNDENKIIYCDGVYYFQLDTQYTQDDEEFLMEDSACTLVSCDLICKIQDYWVSTKDKKVWYYYYALVQGSDCDSCYCTNMCSMYTDLKLLLNDNNISTDTSGCGCS